MISTPGKRHIKRYLAGFVPALAESVAIGVGSLAPAIDQQSLQLEIARVPIDLTSFDFINNNLVFKATLPAELIGKIYEVALYSRFDESSIKEFGSKNITTFDSSSEIWFTGAALSVYSTNARVGLDGLLHQAAVSGSKTSVTDSLTDFSGYSQQDKFVLAFNNSNANLSSITLRFKNDAANYYTYTLSTPALGYNIAEFTKGTAVGTGTPDWSNIVQTEVQSNSNASGASEVVFDSIRVNTAFVDPDYVMISRIVPAEPVVKIDSVSKEIEFALKVNL
jgi:hypothetical protein